ncbi:hypothetical protein BDV23DRAFT_160336 [Aspergillus alliaceus]|uniref:Uncharacterized protein n=1 Tax=Petromyces alliaceus TaxID=209559 RepID=A0A5N7C179_PETAA|nr:hypothetical protein BDV23DRAFT_160336 [Aspergillus alliaceus]
MNLNARSTLRLTECGPSPGERFKVLRCRLLAAQMELAAFSLPLPRIGVSWFPAERCVTREKRTSDDASPIASPVDQLRSARGKNPEYQQILGSIIKYKRHRNPTSRYVAFTLQAESYLPNNQGRLYAFRNGYDDIWISIPTSHSSQLWLSSYSVRYVADSCPLMIGTMRHRLSLV